MGREGIVPNPVDGETDAKGSQESVVAGLCVELFELSSLLFLSVNIPCAQSFLVE